MRVDQFDFELPHESIATHPAEPRDAAKLLHVKTGGEISHRIVRELPDFLRAGDILVFNNTRVIPARLHGMRDAVSIEILLHKELGLSPSSPAEWRCFAKPAKRLKIEQTITFGDGLSAGVIEKLESGEVVLQFNMSGAELYQKLESVGEMPLPPYIDRPDGEETSDKERYQTCYAKRDGSVAAPTAGLHFTPELIDLLHKKGIKIAFVTLHVGGGTFLPVKVEDTSEHVIHSEWGEICERVAEAVNDAKAAGGRVIPVGTTSLRLLESAADDKGVLHPYCGETDIFITPGYKFKIIDLMMTNFHLPKSTLFMLVSAFAGIEQMKIAYKNAIEHNYRFYSYGDGCLLEPKS